MGLGDKDGSAEMVADPVGDSLGAADGVTEGIKDSLGAASHNKAPTASALARDFIIMLVVALPSQDNPRQ